MSWQQAPRHGADPGYMDSGDPYMQGLPERPQAEEEEDTMPSSSATPHSFLASPMTRESEELQRRRLEHAESTEHISPQFTYPQYGTRVGRVTEKKLRENFHLPLTEVAKKFGMCSTAFKKLCRKQGVMQWPYRTLRSLEKKMASLRAEQKFTNDNNTIEEQIAKLQARREQILAGSGAASLPEEETVLPSPSDDSSTSTAQSRSSSPSRGSVDISRVAFENQLNLNDSPSSSSHTHILRHRSMSDVHVYHNQHGGGSHEAAAHQAAARGGGAAGLGRRAQSHESLSTLRQSSYHVQGGLGGLPGGVQPHLMGHAFGVPPVHGNKPTGSVGAHSPGSPVLRDPSASVHDPYAYAGGQRAGSAQPRAGSAGGESYPNSPGRGSGAGPGPGAQETYAQRQQALEAHLQSLLTENNSLRTTIRTLVKEKDAWVRRHDEAQSHIATYRMFAQELEMQLNQQQQQQQQPHGGQGGMGGHDGGMQHGALQHGDGDEGHEHSHSPPGGRQRGAVKEDWGQQGFVLTGHGMHDVDEGDGGNMDFTTLGFGSTNLLGGGSRFVT